MAMKQFFIQCGNWAVKLHLNVKEFDTLELAYIELATKAVEIIFGNGEFSNPEDDYYAIMNDDGVNMLDSDEDYPIPTFTTKVHILSSKNNNPHKLLTSLRTYNIFINAAQYDNAEYALKAEETEK